MSIWNISSIILKSLFTKPSTESYPVKKRVFYNQTRGSVKNDIINCIFCGICVKKCPTNALEVSKTQKAWSIDRFKCIACGACVSACPKECLEMDSAYTSPSTNKTVERYIKPQNEDK